MKNDVKNDVKKGVKHRGDPVRMPEARWSGDLRLSDYRRELLLPCPLVFRRCSRLFQPVAVVNDNLARTRRPSGPTRGSYLLEKKDTPAR